MEYPKIETLYDRDPKTFKVIPAALRLPEFALPRRWLVTEKIDGTNLRVHLQPDGTVTYGGRTDAAQLYAPLVTWLQTRLPAALVASVFDPGTEALIFGEGYGPKIQKGGGLYRADVAMRIFDVAVVAPERVWWLDWSNILDIATKLGVATVPVLENDGTIECACGTVLDRMSRVAIEDGGAGCPQEGIVARTVPLLFTRAGRRLMWKLKVRDL